MLIHNAALTMSTKLPRESERFRADIQGLRAIAVLSVLLFHAFPNVLTGGFVGVDVFFVISGYLISRIIIKDLDAGRYSLADFYRRRVRRIFPALGVMLAATLAAGFALLSPMGFSELGRTVISSVLFASNVDQLKLGGYFSGPSELRPLLHTWSLSVEEQFYLLFPPLLALVWARCRDRAQAILTAMAAASLLCAQLLLWRSASAAFYLTPARGFELLVGAIIATGGLPSLGTRARAVSSLVGAGLILGVALLYTRATPFPGVTALLPCLGAALLIHAGEGGSTPGGRLISPAPLQLIGNMSYSLYLWHWPILAYCRHVFGVELPPHVAALAILASTAAAYASYRFVEQPFLHPGMARLPLLRGGAVMIGSFGAIGAALVILHGLPQRFDDRVLAVFAYSGDFNKRRDECHNGKSYLPYERNCTYGAKRKPDVAVWGDSHAAEVVARLGDRAADLGHSVMQISSSACPPSLGFDAPDRPGCRAHNEATLAALLADDNVRTVVLLVNAQQYASSNFPGRFAEVVTRLAKRKALVLVQQIPIMQSDPPEQIGMAVNWSTDFTKLGRTRAAYEEESGIWNASLAALAANNGASLVAPSTALCDQSLCRMASATGTPLYFNSSHLGLTGASRIVDELMPILHPPSTDGAAASQY